MARRDRDTEKPNRSPNGAAIYAMCPPRCWINALARETSQRRFQKMTASVKRFGCRPITTATPCTGAGVRKAPGKETAGRGTSERAARATVIQRRVQPTVEACGNERAEAPALSRFLGE